MESITLTVRELEKLLGAANGDGTLLYLYLRSQGQQSLSQAEKTLGMSSSRVEAARQLLEQMGLFAQPRTEPPEKEWPVYSEGDVSRYLEKDKQFKLLVGEAQRRLGRLLSTESLKTLLAIYDYLGLPTDVIAFLIGYCVQRAQARGNSNPPTMRTIEKEAANWVQEGLTTLPLAAAYAEKQNERRSLIGQFRSAMGLSGKLSNAEERYLLSWSDMGFAVDAVALAYERTRLSTGSLNWHYMNKILSDWHQQGLHTAAQAQTESRPAAGERKTGRTGQKPPQTGTSESFEQQAVARLQNRSRARED